ncbi:S1 family peptidase [Desulfocurvus sp. DL9XJH121]
MTSAEARAIYSKFAHAVAYIDIIMPSGDRSIGTAFHIGEGVFLTARHVAENVILEIRISEPIPVRAVEIFSKYNVPEDAIAKNDEELKKILGHYPLYKHWSKPLEIEAGPFFHEDKNVDLAVFKVSNIHRNASVTLLGDHWDDWIYRYIWHLSDTVVLGYPPIPMSSEPLLIASMAKILIYFIPRHSTGIHFILSGIPRGGFSGGPAFTESGEVLGVVTSSLVENGMPSELGYVAVISVETIVKCLELNKMYPQIQKDHHRQYIKNASSQKPD